MFLSMGVTSLHQGPKSQPTSACLSWRAIIAVQLPYKQFTMGNVTVMHPLLAKQQKGVCMWAHTLIHSYNWLFCPSERQRWQIIAPCPISYFPLFPHLHRDALNMKTFFSFRHGIKIWGNSPLAQLGMNTVLTSLWCHKVTGTTKTKSCLKNDNNSKEQLK